MKIKVRDVVFFILGLVAFFIAETIYDWEGSKHAFKDGFNSVSKTEVTK